LELTGRNRDLAGGAKCENCAAGAANLMQLAVWPSEPQPRPQSVCGPNEVPEAGETWPWHVQCPGAQQRHFPADTDQDAFAGVAETDSKASSRNAASVRRTGPAQHARSCLDRLISDERLFIEEMKVCYQSLWLSSGRTGLTCDMLIASHHAQRTIGRIPAD